MSIAAKKKQCLCLCLSPSAVLQSTTLWYLSRLAPSFHTQHPAHAGTSIISITSRLRISRHHPSRGLFAAALLPVSLAFSGRSPQVPLYPTLLIAYIKKDDCACLSRIWTRTHVYISFFFLSAGSIPNFLEIIYGRRLATTVASNCKPHSFV